MGSSLHKLRALAAVALPTVGIAGWVVVTAAPAAACSVKDHCYALAYGGASGFDGVDVNISPSCLSVPAGNVVTDETWLVGSGGKAWVEAGFMQEGSRVDVGGIVSAGRYGFWADKRPRHRFYAHVLQHNPPLKDTGVEIYQLSPSSFRTYFNGYVGESKSNTMTPAYGEWGSETTSKAAHSHGRWTAIEYEADSTWDNGVPHPHWNSQSPQTLRWTKKYTKFTAGVPC